MDTTRGRTATADEGRTTERLTVYLDADLRIRLRKQAIDEGTTASRLVERLIREALEVRERHNGDRASK